LSGLAANAERVLGICQRGGIDADSLAARLLILMRWLFLFLRLGLACFEGIQPAAIIFIMTTLAPILTSKMTAEQYFQLGEDPPGVHLELINGEIVVSPSPGRTHQQIIVALGYLLEGHLRKTKLGSIYPDTDVVFEEDTVRRPDIAFYGSAKLKRIKGERLLLPPDLCIEVTSPSNEDDDRINKFNLYRKHRVAHYWIFDPEIKTAECYKLRAGQYIKIVEGSDNGTVHFPTFADLAIPLAELWYGNR